MDMPYITAKRIGGYVFVISLLLLGSIMCAWWVLNGQLVSQKNDSTSLVSYASPGLSTITSSTAESLAVTSQDIVNGAVEGQDIAIGGVKKDNLSPSVVSWIESLRLEGLLPLDLSISEAMKLLTGTLGSPLSDITSLQILDGSVALVDLDDNIVDTLGLVGTVADNSITSLKIVDGAVAGADIGAGAVDTLNIAISAITGDLIANGAVNALEIADGAVTSSKIFDGTIAAADIASGTLTGAQVQDGSISTSDLALDIITGALIASGTIGETDIANGAVSGVKILDGTIGAADIAAGVVDSNLITDGTITANDIASGAINTLQLADGAVTSSKIFDGTIAATDIANGAIGSLQLGTGSVQATKLSTASGKKTVNVQIGDISVVLGDTERPIFVAPTNGTITKVTFTNGLSITAGLNKGIMSVERKTASTATVASVDLGSISLTGFVPQSPVLGGGTAFSVGDVYSFKWDAGLIGVALTGFLATIEYLPSE